MNIFWIVTDSICNYERSDLHGLLPTYRKLEENNEGFYFKDAISQFPSTNLSLFSFLTGRFPYYIFPDYYRSIENLPSLRNNNLISPLKKKNFNIQSIIFGREQAEILKDILNPYYEKDMYKGYHWLEPQEVYQFFIQKMVQFLPDENNFFFILFRPSSSQTDFYLNKIIKYLKLNCYWDNSIIVINSDHGFYDSKLYKKTKLRHSMHFDDIHQSSMKPILFIKLPQGLTKSPPKTIEERVYLVDIMETILNYLNISATHDRESISFKDLIEKNIDINKERSIRGDCYLMFQAAKRTMIIKDNWKLTNNNGIFSLHNLSEDLLEKKDVKEDFKQIYYELYDFYMKTEIDAYNSLKNVFNSLFEQSLLQGIKNKKILIPNQFPPQLVKFLREKLKIDNEVVTENGKIDCKRQHVTILFLNRLTGYGIKKMIREYKKHTKQFIILNTELNDVSDQLNKTGYLRFVIRSIYNRRKHFFQRWAGNVIWIFYFPLYFNKYIKKYYKN